MSGPAAVESFATHLEQVVLPSVASELGLVDLDAQVTSAQTDTYPSVRLNLLDESSGSLEGIHLVQLTLKVARTGPLDDFKAMQIRDKIRVGLGFTYSLGFQRAWLDQFDYEQDPPVKNGVLHIEPASSKIWVTRTSTDPGLIQSAMRLKIYFDGVDT